MTLKKKVVIFEDNVIDLIERYKELNSKDYETFVFFNQWFFDKEELEREGFKNVYQGLPKKLFAEDHLKQNSKKFVDLSTGILNPPKYQNKIWLNEENVPKADYYFSDGLNYLCFKVVKILPKEKVIINSSNDFIVSRAREKGYKALNSVAINQEIITNYI